MNSHPASLAQLEELHQEHKRKEAELQSKGWLGLAQSKNGKRKAVEQVAREMEKGTRVEVAMQWHAMCSL